ncbi:MAG: hypothetical protein Q4G34_01010 [Micrococcus sp.]|nr:hypothetical protein [Micrococcus sp.]
MSVEHDIEDDLDDTDVELERLADRIAQHRGRLWDRMHGDPTCIYYVQAAELREIPGESPLRGEQR